MPEYENKLNMEKVGIGSQVNHRSFGNGVVVEIDGDNYTIYFNELAEVKEINREFDGISVLEKVAPEYVPIEISDIENALESILKRSSKLGIPIIPLANKWIDGTVTINAGVEGMQGKDISIRTFFNKIIMVRERLRVLEQNINNHDKLDEADKLHLQQYLTRAYGSLTTFNVLFSEKEDHFKGAGK